MAATPLIRSLRTSSGTIYVFNSASNDIAKTFSDDNFRFTFSKFAALDLPKVNIPSNGSNNIVWQSIGNKNNVGGTTWDSDVVFNDLQGVQSNTHLANSFQNYVLNWENIILNKENSIGNLYDTSSKQSITERLFWKWLIDLGAIRFTNATDLDSNVENRYIEEKENNSSGSDIYNTVVRYLGDIDLINNVNRGGEAYSQVYLHIPTEHGSTPTVLFKTLSDNNYSPNLSWLGTNGDYIEGRNSHVDPKMSILAYFGDTINDSYSTENTFGDTTNREIVLANDIDFTNQFTHKISNMDGAVIDWESSNYYKVTNTPGIQNISELNLTAEAQDFSFNTILIYYDIYDTSDTTLIKRNLYGVLFVDDFKDSLSNGSELKSYTKFKPNPITKLNGNAYSLKTNIKFDTSADNVGVERSINEYSTFSMDLFSDAMVQLQNATEMFISQAEKLGELDDKVDNLEKFYFSQNTINELNAKVDSLQQSVNNALISLESPTTLIELIRKNSERINALASGKLTTNLSYDLTPFVQGKGIILDKSVPDKVILNNVVQTYNYFSICYNDSKSLDYSAGNGIYDVNNIEYTTKNNILALGNFTNYFKNETIGNLQIDNDVSILIDDSVEKFATGQVFRIVFKNDFRLNDTKSLYIYTDAKNNKQQGKYKWLIGKLSNVDFVSNKPIIEIICKNSTTMEFTIDVVR